MAEETEVVVWKVCRVEMKKDKILFASSIIRDGQFKLYYEFHKQTRGCFLNSKYYGPLAYSSKEAASQWAMGNYETKAILRCVAKPMELQPMYDYWYLAWGELVETKIMWPEHTVMTDWITPVDFIKVRPDRNDNGSLAMATESYIRKLREE